MPQNVPLYMQNTRGKLLYYMTSSIAVVLTIKYLINFLTHQQREITQIPNQVVDISQREISQILIYNPHFMSIYPFFS